MTDHIDVIWCVLIAALLFLLILAFTGKVKVKKECVDNVSYLYMPGERVLTLQVGLDGKPVECKIP